MRATSCRWRVDACNSLGLSPVRPHGLAPEPHPSGLAPGWGQCCRSRKGSWCPLHLVWSLKEDQFALPLTTYFLRSHEHKSLQRSKVMIHTGMRISVTQKELRVDVMLLLNTCNVRPELERPRPGAESGYTQGQTSSLFWKHPELLLDWLGGMDE